MKGNDIKDFDVILLNMKMKELHVKTRLQSWCMSVDLLITDGHTSFVLMELLSNLKIACCDLEFNAVTVSVSLFFDFVCSLTCYCVRFFTYYII